jgi:hypothetical protein
MATTLLAFAGILGSTICGAEANVVSQWLAQSFL